jgi:hypothetical protein
MRPACKAVAGARTVARTALFPLDFLGAHLPDKAAEVEGPPSSFRLEAPMR